MAKQPEKPTTTIAYCSQDFNTAVHDRTFWKSIQKVAIRRLPSVRSDLMAQNNSSLHWSLPSTATPTYLVTLAPEHSGSWEWDLWECTGKRGLAKMASPSILPTGLLQVSCRHEPFCHQEADSEPSPLSVGAVHGSCRLQPGCVTLDNWFSLQDSPLLAALIHATIITRVKQHLFTICKI